MQVDLGAFHGKGEIFAAPAFVAHLRRLLFDRGESLLREAAANRSRMIAEHPEKAHLANDPDALAGHRIATSIARRHALEDAAASADGLDGSSNPVSSQDNSENMHVPPLETP
jgi:hypothetical protein